MTTHEYISTYEANKENFEKHFKENAQQYWKIWKLHYFDGIFYIFLNRLYYKKPLFQ